MNWIAVFIGGGLGCLIRYLYSLIFISSSFPYATFWSNVTAGLLAGIFLALVERTLISEWWSLFFIIGFCGGFSTFSTFTVDWIFLIREKEIFKALIYMMSSIFITAITFLAGYYFFSK